MSSAPTTEQAETLADLLDATPPELVRQAFSHASWTRPRPESYERLAFMGDAVLALAVSTHLYPLLASYGVGRLTKVRAQAVSGSACAQVARDFGFDERLRAQAPDGDEHGLDALLTSERVLASVCEAVIGAVYFGCGYERVAPAVVAAFAEQMDIAVNRSADFKSVLQERLARRGQVVDYAVVEESGPPHDRHFVIAARVKGSELGRGEGRTKKLAEQEAAEQALEDFGGGRT
ncbi:MAG: ribonuclease III [Solirubrobacterales bacterium]|nr:ribonuclease III [Solirubrobacterales bacterium]